jgi:hypothetical protein
MDSPSEVYKGAHKMGRSKKKGNSQDIPQSFGATIFKKTNTGEFTFA